MKIIIIALLICLLAVFFQDIKYRQIHILWVVLIFLFSAYIFKVDKKLSTTIFLYNSGFFLLSLLFLMVYMTVKNKIFINPFENYFGLGDLLFFIAVAPLFLTYNYILFFILSMLFSIVIHLIFIKSMKVKTVPLAGFSSLFLVLIIIKDLFFSFNKITIIG